MNNRASRGLLDTSVVIDLDSVPETALPQDTAIAAITLAELSAGLHTTSDPAGRSARAGRLQRSQVVWDPLPFGANAARHYGHLVALVAAAGRKPRPHRLDS